VAANDRQEVEEPTPQIAKGLAEIGKNPLKIRQTLILEVRIDHHGFRALGGFEEPLGEFAARISFAAVEELSVNQLPVLMEYVIGPLEWDGFIGTCTDVERNGWRESLEVDEVNGELHGSEPSRAAGSTTRLPLSRASRAPELGTQKTRLDDAVVAK